MQKTVAWLCRRQTAVFVAALAVIVAGPAAFAVNVQSDFDPGGTYYGGIEGWFNYAGLPDFGTSTPVGGTTLWLRVKPNQYWGQITSQSWATPGVTVADWNSYTHLEFDVIVDSLWLPNNPAQVIDVEFQVGGGVQGTVNKYAYPTINTSLKDTIQHVDIDLTALQPFDPTATYWNLSFNLRPGYAWEWDPSNPNVQPYDPRFYIDNVTWTPEPAALGTLVLVGLAGLRRRRD